MKTARFVLSYILFVLTDGLLTWVLVSQADISAIIARAGGAVVCVIGFFFIQQHLSEGSEVSPFLSGCIGTVSTMVGYGIFALLLSRNAILQWPVPFVASAAAAIILCGFGYWRAEKSILKSD